MAEQIHYRPAEAKQYRKDTLAEFERLEGRVAEINGLLDELYDSGLIRWLKDFAGAFPQISSIAVESMNTPQGHAGMRNLLVVAKQLGKIDPDQLERTFEAANAGLAKGIAFLREFTPIDEWYAQQDRRIAGLRAQANAHMRDALTQMEDLHRQGVVPDRVLQELRNSIRL